ncbi:MAG: M55 family metallopeptidase [Anaerolineales bacterium]|nr:M55 family metallopeptidase [Anaerolineales bacterium]
MNILISADMEGISGVVLADQTTSGNKEYDRFRRLMTADVNAAIEGALAGGADHIVVNDSHGSMTNILIEELNPAAELISGKPKPFDMMQGIGNDIDAVFLVGYHAASGARAAVLEHTWTLRLIEVRLNDQPVGEMGLSAAVAGAFGVPVVLVTGDLAVTQEARALLGEVEVVPVKEALTRTAAQCIHPEVAHSRIRQAAQRAVSRPAAPLTIPLPVTLQIAFIRSTQADLAAMLPGSQRVDGRTVAWTGESMQDVHRAFLVMVHLALLES